MFGSRPPPKLLLKSYGNVEGELSDPRASKLVAQMNKWCSDANFAAQQQAMEHKRHEIAQMLESRHESLSRSGALLLEFRWDASGRNAGCLIGGDRAYLYNLQDRHMETQPIDPGEIDKLSTVAKGLLGQTFVSQPTSDPGDNSWIASIESSSVVLKRTGTFAFKGGLSDPRAQELIAVIDRWCPGANEATQRVELTQKETKFHRELSEHTAELRKNGPTFEFHYHNDAWGYVNVGCIIGDGGNVQTFDFKQEPFFQVTARVNESDYKRALSLAAPLVGQHYTSHFAGADGGNARWTITVGGSETKIKESVDTEGELTDPAAAEVVQFIAQWCPSAEGFLKFERHLRGFHPQ